METRQPCARCSGISSAKRSIASLSAGTWFRARCLWRRSNSCSRSRGARYLCVANTDRWVVEACDALARDPDAPRAQARPAAAWTAAAMTREQRDFVASFDDHAVLDVDGLGPTLFCHGSPRSDEEIFTRLTPERRWRPMVEGVEQRVVVCGHTHAQFDRALG